MTGVQTCALPIFEVGFLQKRSDMDDTAMAGQPIDGVLDANDRAHGFHLPSESFLCACIPYLTIYYNALCDILGDFVPRIKVKNII